MVFVDGENLVIRYQDMLNNGRKPLPKTSHERDIFVWNSRIFNEYDKDIIRTTYYTSATGDDRFINEISNRIRQLTFGSGYPKPSVYPLYPCVYKKVRKEQKAKGVDIQMTVDILTNIYNDNLDIIYLFSGDGDYIPLINEAIRAGKLIYIAAFSSGLNERMRLLADIFINLDGYFFED